MRRRSFKLVDTDEGKGYTDETRRQSAIFAGNNVDVRLIDPVGVASQHDVGSSPAKCLEPL